jgi:hypothetical protein
MINQSLHHFRKLVKALEAWWGGEYAVPKAAQTLKIFASFGWSDVMRWRETLMRFQQINFRVACQAGEAIDKLMRPIAWELMLVCEDFHFSLDGIS